MGPLPKGGARMRLPFVVAIAFIVALTYAVPEKTADADMMLSEPPLPKTETAPVASVAHSAQESADLLEMQTKAKAGHYHGGYYGGSWNSHSGFWNSTVCIIVTCVVGGVFFLVFALCCCLALCRRIFHCCHYLDDSDSDCDDDCQKDQYGSAQPQYGLIQHSGG